MSSPPLQDLCIRLPHLLEGILDYLSASEAASLLAVLDLLKNNAWKPTRDKYVHQLRDIPEHASWITRVVAEGHKVLFIGHDLTRWKKRLEDPLEYWAYHSDPWNETPLKIWVAVRVVTDLYKKRAIRFGHRTNYYRPYTTDVDGHVVAGVQRAQYQGRYVMRRNILPLSGDYQPTRNVEWRRSTKPNLNNIRAVWADFPDGSEHTTPCVRICPIQDNLRTSGDAMKGSHFCKTQNCLERPPGAVCKTSSTDKLCPFMPYIDLKDGELKECRLLDSFGNQQEYDRFAVLIKFSCFGAQDDPMRATGLAVFGEIQGIPL